MINNNDSTMTDPDVGPDAWVDPDGWAILRLFAREVDCILFGNDTALIDKVHWIQGHIRHEAATGHPSDLIGEAVQRSNRLTKLVDDWCDAQESSAKSRTTKMEVLKDKIRLELICHEFASAGWFRDQFGPSAA